MKLKTRLTIAFLIIILVPAILFSVAFFGFTRYQVNVIEDKYVVSISFESMANLHYITIFLHTIHFLQSFAKMHGRKSAE